jgi:hypothetical protein
MERAAAYPPGYANRKGLSAHALLKNNCAGPRYAEPALMSGLRASDARGSAHSGGTRRMQRYDAPEENLPKPLSGAAPAPGPSARTVVAGGGRRWTACRHLPLHRRCDRPTVRSAAAVGAGVALHPAGAGERRNRRACRQHGRSEADERKSRASGARDQAVGGGPIHSAARSTKAAAKASHDPRPPSGEATGPAGFTGRHSPVRPGKVPRPGARQPKAATTLNLTDSRDSPVTEKTTGSCLARRFWRQDHQKG